MGDRYYNQMLNKLGTCPGYNGRKKPMKWTDELRQEVVEQYNAANPTAENSMEIVKEIAEDMGASANGVRMILSKAGVYQKKTPSSSSSGSTGGGRLSKAAAQEALTKAITDAGQDADEEIISRLTGKAAVYLASVINAINE